MNTIIPIKDFQKAYPNLWVYINETRVESGSKPLDEEYTDNFVVPIRMTDASLAENCLQKGVKDGNLGYNQLKKIKEAIQSEPNMLRWMDVLYYADNPRGLYTDRYNEPEYIKKPKHKKTQRKEENIMDRKNKIDGEIIALVEADGDSGQWYKATNRETGEDLTAVINDQKKLKYAFKNAGAVRGRTKADGSVSWRVVKERFIRNDEPVAEATVTPAE